VHQSQLIQETRPIWTTMLTSATPTTLSTMDTGEGIEAVAPRLIWTTTPTNSTPTTGVMLVRELTPQTPPLGGV